ncbi:ATP-binding protein [Neorhizobium sp. T6_25]|uniref:ATP-binding protein n=1 Tax=Neorhizobium sp. T6_25 TaxID=2093833 RepID=UPI000CF8DF64|nr:ATP-binding protein [Neorhizobium sp. T6_25]
MRIQQIKIDRWRHFEGVSFVLPDAAPIICIVGGNGTGKSQILELIAACAQRIGLTPGTESPRANPFGENAAFEVSFFVAPQTIPNVDDDVQAYPEPLQHDYTAWDRTLVVRSRTDQGSDIVAGGVPSGRSSEFAHHIIQIIQQSASVHYLSLDADRAYPKVQIAAHQLTEVYDRDWGDATNKQSSFRITRNLYDEWFRFLIGRENQENNKHVQAIRIARNSGAPEPVFADQFETYKNAVRKVLPHLLFVGIDPQTRQIRFDSTGIPLTFDQLSGGEREIAFLVGQIQRFGLKRGLLLVDEPELHLNYDLLRAWIGFLKDSVEAGQIWLATHSLEVVEVTGQDATVILSRDEKTRRVTSAAPLSEQPVIATLSRAIGSPAFSISNLAFVMIEGAEEIGERERFRLLCDLPPHVRFLEAGSCKEVVRRIEGLKDLATASDQGIRIGGVIDRDWRTKAERENLVNQGLHVLEVHEVENFFLHPPTLTDWLPAIGKDPEQVQSLLLTAADRRAGAWIFDAARTDRKFREYPEPSKAVRELVHNLAWPDFGQLEERCAAIANAHGGLSDADRVALEKHLVTRARIYSRMRESEDLWKVCEGKEIFRSILPHLGLADGAAAERAITTLWVRKPELVPSELQSLRRYIQNL